jgi:hypothetical protein
MKILLTLDEFRDFGGAELVVLELMEWFAAEGWSVVLLTRSCGGPLREEVDQLVREQRLTIHEGLGADINPHDFDLMWIAHSVVPLSVLTLLTSGFPRCPVLWLHMGSLHPRESVVLPEIESALATTILTVSGRTRERMIELGLPPQNMAIFDNPVPASFANESNPRPEGDLRTILCVSNHPPEEIRQLESVMGHRGVNVDTLGAGGNRGGRLTPQLLSAYDAVITIGKTTQYCLAMGIPVYSYDHFGGVGWLTADNVQTEAFHNFTGYRTGHKRTTLDIAQELVGGFQQAQRWSTQNSQHWAEHYSLDRQVRSLLHSATPTESRFPLDPGVVAEAVHALQRLWREKQRG